MSYVSGRREFKLKWAVFIVLSFVCSSLAVVEATQPADAREICKITVGDDSFSNYLWNDSRSEMRVQASSGVADFTNAWTSDSRWNFARVQPQHTTDGWKDHPGDDVCDLDFFWAKEKIRIHEPVCRAENRSGIVGCTDLSWPWKKTLAAKRWHKVDRNWRYITCFSGTSVPTDNTILRCFASPVKSFNHFANNIEPRTIRLDMNPMRSNHLNPLDQVPSTWDVPRGGESKSTTSNVTTCPTKWARCPTA